MDNTVRQKNCDRVSDSGLVCPREGGEGRFPVPASNSRLGDAAARCQHMVRIVSPRVVLVRLLLCVSSFPCVELVSYRWCRSCVSLLGVFRAGGLARPRSCSAPTSAHSKSQPAASLRRRGEKEKHKREE